MEPVPHPQFPRPDVALLDYPMQDGVLRIRARAALAGYVLAEMECRLFRRSFPTGAGISFVAK